MKADEIRLYALRGGLKKQSVCYTHFHSNKVFRGDLIQKNGCRIWHPFFLSKLYFNEIRDYINALIES